MLADLTRRRIIRATTAGTRVAAVTPAGEPVVLTIARGPHAERLHVTRGILGDLAGVAGIDRCLGIETHGPETTLIVATAAGPTLAAPARPTRAVALDHAVQLARIVRDVHRQGVVHRDLQPAHVVLTGAPATLHLTGFDAAHSRRRGDAGARVEGHPACMAPEQTGAIDRPVDERADLYALGVILFQLFAHRPPFEGRTPADLARAHLVACPPRLDALVPGTPRALADICARLLEKAPDRRYQTAHGLLLDLRHVQARLAAGAPLQGFVPARLDRARSLPPTRTLHGRAAVVERLVGHLAAAGDRPRLVLLIGEAGVGKSAVMQAARQAVVEADGRVLGGKFEQFRALTPFSAFGQAFDHLADQLQHGAPAILDGWRARLASALGGLAGAIADLAPRLAELIGPIGERAAIEPTERQSRLPMAVARVIEVAGALSPGPLVLMLDDMQWADASSVSLLETLLGGPTPLIVLASSRPAEAPPWAPLREALEARGRALVVEALAPLTDRDVRALVVDLAGRDGEDVDGLARLVARRSENNPLLARQVLTRLVEGGLIRLGPRGAWRWDPAAIERAGLPETIVGIMAARIASLPSAPAAVLAVAACVGSVFDLDVVRAISGLDAEGFEAAVDDLRHHDLFAPGRRGWHFTHDRVQEAAYHRLSEGERRALHRRIGEHLLAALGDPASDPRLFAVVDHLHRGGGSSPDRRIALELLAGRRAIEQGAWQAACGYLDAGLRLVDGLDDPAERRAAWTELALERAQAAFLGGDFAGADARFADLLGAVVDAGQRVRIRARQLTLLSTRARFDEALTAGLAGLAEVGVRLPRRPSRARVRAEMARALRITRSGRLDPPDRPPADPLSQRALKLMPALASAAYALDRPLMLLAFARNVRELAARGGSPAAANALANFALALAATGRIARARSVAEQAERLCAAADAGDVARVTHVLWMFVWPWYRSFAEGLGPLRAAYRSARDAGDLEYALVIAIGGAMLSFLACAPLDGLTAELGEAHRALAPYASGSRLMMFEDTRRYVGYLTGATPPDLDALVRDDRHDDGATATERRLLVAVPILCVFGRFDLARAAADQLDAAHRAFFGLAFGDVFHFYRAFARLCDAPDGAARRIARRTRRRLAARRRHRSGNLAGCVEALDAERARAAGRSAEAHGHYGRAAEAAAEQGNHMLHGLIEERRASLRAADGMPSEARRHLQNAVEAYARWGARAKVDALRAAMGGAVEAEPAATPATAEPSAAEAAWRLTEQLADARSVDAVARIALDAALRRPGITRGLLVMAQDDGGLRARAERRALGRIRLLDEPLSPAAEGFDPIREAARAGAPVTRIGPPPDVGGDAPPRARSAMGLPLRAGETLVGVLYLESDQAAADVDRALGGWVDGFAAPVALALRGARLHEASAREIERLESRLRQHAAELSDARAEALEGVKSRNAFLGAMSHELRTPMNGLLGTARLLEGMALGPEPGALVGHLVHASESLVSVLGDILDYAQLDADMLHLDAAPFALAEVIAQVCDPIAEIARVRGIATHIATATAVPARITGDARRLGQILEQLVGNAAKFTDHGQIRLDVRPGEVGVRFEVHDTGPGIAPEQLDRLFSAFSMGDDTLGRRFGGKGIGLAICLKLVELMGGRIGATSERGVGSTFWFEVPLEAAVERREAPASSGEAAPQCTVLVAEDNPINQRVTGRMLERAGHAFTIVSDGEQAVEAVERGGFDVVLMDCQMPGMDGLEATRRLRAGGCALPIIALTAGVLDAERQACFAAGMDAFLAKPVKPRALAATIEAQLIARAPRTAPAR